MIPHARLVLILVLLISPGAVMGQVPQPDAVPSELIEQERTDLFQKRSNLLDLAGSLEEEIQDQKMQCGHVNTKDAGRTQFCQQWLDRLRAQYSDYINKLKSYEQEVVHQKKKLACMAVPGQVRKDREEIERQMRSNEASQEELREWNKLNEKAQYDAVVAGIKFAAGEFAADAELVRGSVSKLERHAVYLAKKADQSRKLKTRMMYVSQLDATLGPLNAMQHTLMAKAAVKTGLDIEKAWGPSRDTMHHEFRVARKHNGSIREVLKDHAFKEAFTGEDIDTPGLDVLSSLVEQAGEELGKMELGLQRYEKFTGPSIRAAVFVRDSAYSALLSALSTQRVLQQSDLAGSLAKAAGVLQERYKKSIDSLHDCRKAGFAQ